MVLLSKTNVFYQNIWFCLVKPMFSIHLLNSSFNPSQTPETYGFIGFIGFICFLKVFLSFRENIWFCAVKPIVSSKIYDFAK